MAAKNKVFISHKRDDSDVAQAIQRRLNAKGIETYLDVVDNALRLNGVDLADYLRGKLDQCDHLIAVISTTTQSSWWVPWEIGVATEKRHFLASFVTTSISVPDFLKKWPYLRSLSDVDAFAEQSLYTNRDRSRREAAVLSESAKSRIRASTFDDFQYGLKRRLDQ